MFVKSYDDRIERAQSIRTWSRGYSMPGPDDDLASGRARLHPAHLPVAIQRLVTISINNLLQAIKPKTLYKLNEFARFLKNEKLLFPANRKLKRNCDDSFEITYTA